MALTLQISSTGGSSLLQCTNGVRSRPCVELQVSRLVYSYHSRMPLSHVRLSSNVKRFCTGNSQLRLNSNGRVLNSGAKEIWDRINHQSQRQNRLVTSASLAGPGTVEVAASVFQLATAFVVPFYTIMILAPKWVWTQKLMESELTYFILGAGYFYLLYLSWTPETLGLMFSSKYWLPELSGITRMFASTLTVASAWLHLLAADLFAGRQVFLDGLQHNVETRHSLVLCLMMCPIGIFCHMITKSVTLILRSRIQGDAEITNDISSY